MALAMKKAELTSLFMYVFQWMWYRDSTWRLEPGCVLQFGSGFRIGLDLGLDMALGLNYTLILEIGPRFRKSHVRFGNFNWI